MGCLDWRKLNSQLGCPDVNNRCMGCSTDNVQKYPMSIDYPGSWRFSSQHCWKEFLPDASLSQALLNSWWPCNYTQQMRKEHVRCVLAGPLWKALRGRGVQDCSRIQSSMIVTGDQKQGWFLCKNKCQWQAEHPFLDYVTKLLQLTYWVDWETPELSPIDL